MLAISDPEVTLPTLDMNSDQLNELSLSGIINTIGIIPQEPQQHQGTTIQVDPNTIPGQGHPITFTLQEVQQPQISAVRDITDHLVGFPDHQGNPLDTWNTNQHYTVQQQNNTAGNIREMEQKPHVRILEQPASHKLRFRYQCEGRGAGALQGQTSNPEKKTFPKIQIVGYKGPAVVVVSCVTHDSDPPKTHPHNLVSPASVGRDGCKKGVCTMNVNSEDMTVEFQHLGIQCVRKKDIAEALKQRQEIRVDPYRQGFNHIESAGTIDLNAVKLCFQAFLESPTTPGKYTVILPPVCSKPIFDAKAKKELQIMDISDNSASVEGGKKIIVLCERVSREDIKVKFYDPDPNSHWEEWAEFNAADVHKQYAISLKTPRYDDLAIKEPKKVFLELVKPSDDSRSDPMEFFFEPTDKGASQGTKRDKDQVGSLDSGKMVIAPKNPYNGGGYSVAAVKEELHNSPNPIKIKHESGETWKHMTSQAAQMASKPRVDPYSQVVLSDVAGGLGLRPSQYDLGQGVSTTVGYNFPEQQVYNIQPGASDPNYQYSINSPYSQGDSQSPYSIAQPSPDSQGIANMNITSPRMPQDIAEIERLDFDQLLNPKPESDPDMENLSDKIQNCTFDETPNIQPLNQRSAPKRSSKDAENDSASIHIPPQMDRQQSTLQTPNVSGTQLTTPNVSANLSDILRNCNRINDLDNMSN
jgi:hypothetical protein